MFLTRLEIAEVSLESFSFKKRLKNIFTGKTWFAPKQKWELTKPLVYQGATDQFTVPAGFITDFASTPAIVWSFLPPTGKHNKASVLHDYFYSTKEISKEDSDGIFRRIMRESGVSKFTRYTMWKGVSLFGFLSWKKNG